MSVLSLMGSAQSGTSACPYRKVVLVLFYRTGSAGLETKQINTGAQEEDGFKQT